MALLGPKISPFKMPFLRRLSLFLILLGGLASLLFTSEVCAAKGSDEAVIKAAFIYNFTKFASWPEDSCPEEYLFIGIMASDPVSRKLELLEGRKSGQRMIKVIRLKGASDSNCVNLIYVPNIDAISEEDLKFMRQRHILVVADGRDAVSKGAAISLYKKQNRIRFDINLKVAKDSGIELSSRLLSLAVRVIR